MRIHGPTRAWRHAPQQKLGRQTFGAVVKAVLDRQKVKLPVYCLPTDRRRTIFLLVGPDLMWCLDRIGAMFNSAADGNRESKRELRRLRIWEGPKYWDAIQLMVHEGVMICDFKRIKVRDCRDALALAIDLEQERVRWGMK